MGQPDWLEKVLSLGENIPYQGILTIGGEYQRSIKGEPLFRVEDGELNFRFFIDDDESWEAGHQAFAASSHTNIPLELRIPSQDFAYPAIIIGIPSRGMTGQLRCVEGLIATNFYGPSDEMSDVANIWLRGIPTGWYGPDYWVHFHGISRQPIRCLVNGETILSGSVFPSLTALGGFTLRTDGWTSTLREIPAKDRIDSEVGHLCTIRQDEGTMTGKSAAEFIEENLFPYLSFVFGRKIRYDQVMGDAWAMVPRRQKNIPRTLNRNWFLVSRHDVDLSSLFHAYCKLPEEVKAQWRRVIDQYAKSEEIMGTLGETAIAASVSFSSLEGLTRSFISTYEQRDEWLTKNLALKRGKSIIKAVEMVAKKELGAHETVFEQASQAVYNVRNQTMHLDLKADEDSENAYHRWNSSQALIEILLLARMGLTEIPNRTFLGTLNVMGTDMYEAIRKEELVFRQTEVEPEAGRAE